MDHIGIDVHKRESQICILAEGGELARRATDLHGRGPLRGRARRSTPGADRHGNWPLSWARSRVWKPLQRASNVESKHALTRLASSRIASRRIPALASGCGGLMRAFARAMSRRNGPNRAAN